MLGQDNNKDKAESFKVTTWWFDTCPLAHEGDGKGCTRANFKQWFCASQLSEDHARLMLWIHFARSGKHYGKHTAEDLYALVMGAPIKESQSEVWMEPETRHVDFMGIPKTFEEAQAMYAEFSDGDYKEVAEDAVPAGRTGVGNAEGSRVEALA